jgi:hypothetical protein
MDEPENWLAGFQRLQTLREAIASVSLSHEENCTCDTCRAAGGDERAFAILYERAYLRG